MEGDDPASIDGERFASVLVGTPSGRSAWQYLPLVGDVPLKRTNVVSVLYDATAEGFLDEWRTRADTLPADLELVAVGTPSRSTVSHAGTASPSPGVATAVADYDDFEGVTEAVRDALTPRETREQTLLYVDSLDVLFDAVDLRSAVQFVGNLTDLLARVGARGLFEVPLGSDALAAARPRFDATVEVGLNEHGPTGDADERPPEPSVDTVFDVLRKPARRIVLESLLRADGPVDARRLAERVVERTGDDGPEDRRRAYVSLRHAHLPRLEEAEFVSYDVDAGTVEALDAASTTRPYLSLAIPDSRTP